MSDKPKKKFRNTRVGKFLTKKLPAVLGIAGDILPDAGLLNKIKSLIEKEPTLSKEDKEHALMLIEMDKIEMQEVSKRWASDMQSDSYLSKNTRPMTLIFLNVSLVIFILLDGFKIDFSIDPSWVDLLKSLLITVYIAYFGSRGAEKFKAISKN